MTIDIVGDEVRVRTPEGQTWTLEFDRAARLLNPDRMQTCGVVLPDGMKYVASRGGMTVWVHQTPPRVHNFKWIREDSPAPYGPGATYREVKIALPYVIVFAMFVKDPRGRLQLGPSNECFFRNDPIATPADALSYPSLLNCSKFEDPEGHPLSWICTQHLDTRRQSRILDDNERVRVLFRVLLHSLFETGFNFSSEHHEETSWFTESRRVDPRIETVEAWEAATREDPWFVTTLPWKPVGLSVEELADRMLGRAKNGTARKLTPRDLARMVANHGAPAPDGGPEGEETS